MQIYTLSAQERSEVWTQLTPDQKEVFNTYTMDRITSELLTRSFRMSSHWRLISVNIDYGWEMRKKTGNKRGYQYCECGRKLKYQYELESVKNPKKHLLLGSTHFAEEAGIPTKIALEIQGRVNEIQIYMDEILYRYKHGDRFREDRFGYLFDLGVMDEPTHFNTKIKAFRGAGLPLFHVDQNRMLDLTIKYKRPKIKVINTVKQPDKSKQNSIPSGANPNIRNSVDVQHANHLIEQINGVNLQSNLNIAVLHYVNSTFPQYRTTFHKIIPQISNHIVKMIPAANRKGLFTEEFNRRYWTPLSNSLVDYERWKLVDGYGVLKLRHHDLQASLLLFRALTLEEAIWVKLLNGKLPSVDWQISQLGRISFLMSQATRNLYGQSVIGARKHLSSRIGKIHNILKNNPTLYTDEAGYLIQQLYQLVLTRNAEGSKITYLLNQIDQILAKPRRHR